MNYPYLFRKLLNNPDFILEKKFLPQTDKEWLLILDFAYRNRLRSYLFYLISHRKYKKIIPKWVAKQLYFLYAETSLRHQNYRCIVQKLKEFIKSASIPLILIKDPGNDDLTGYPKSYIPLKYDIDILGRNQDLTKLRKFIEGIGYDPKGHHWGAPDHPIPQYKFTYSKQKMLYPVIEFRYQTITIPSEKMAILEKEDIKNLTKEFWQVAKISKNNFAKLPREYLFIHLCLIFYFEDGCKGLNNLYRIRLLFNNEKNTLNWNKINSIAGKYRVTKIISFVLALVNNIFSPEAKTETNFSTRIVLRIVDLPFICRAYMPSDGESFGKWKDGYIHFLTRGLLIELPIWRKIVFFLHPKRIIFLLLSLL